MMITGEVVTVIATIGILIITESTTIITFTADTATVTNVKLGGKNAEAVKVGHLSNIILSQISFVLSCVLVAKFLPQSVRHR